MRLNLITIEFEGFVHRIANQLRTIVTDNELVETSEEPVRERSNENVRIDQFAHV